MREARLTAWLVIAATLLLVACSTSMRRSSADIIVGAAGCQSFAKRTRTVAETEELRAATIQAAEQVVTPTPVQVETTNPDGSTTTITAAPQSETTYSLSDNTDASSTTTIKYAYSVGIGISLLGNVALGLLAYLLWAKFTAVGRVADKAGAKVLAKSRIIENTMSALTNCLASATDPQEVARLQSIRNSLERD